MLNHANQLLERVASVNSQPALSCIGEGTHYHHSASGRVPSNGFSLVLRRVLLVFRGHAHVLCGGQQWEGGVIHKARP
jgi:hypothetical protein